MRSSSTLRNQAIKSGVGNILLQKDIVHISRTVFLNNPERTSENTQHGKWSKTNLTPMLPSSTRTCAVLEFLFSLCTLLTFPPWILLQTKGTTSFGKRHSKSHTLCRRCGKSSFHIQKKQCASCGYPLKKMRSYHHHMKAARRRCEGTGRMKHKRHLPRRAKNGFREGTKAKKVLKNWVFSDSERTLFVWVMLFLESHRKYWRMNIFALR